MVSGESGGVKPLLLGGDSSTLGGSKINLSSSMAISPSSSILGEHWLLVSSGVAVADVFKL